MKKAFWPIVLSLLFAILIGYFLPQYVKQDNTILSQYKNETSLVSQEILSYSDSEKTYTKIYVSGSFIGVISDMDYINSLIDKKYSEFEEIFPNTSLGLVSDVYTVKEKSFAVFEDKDDQIMNYLVTHNLLGIKTTCVEFYTTEGIYDYIYVKDYEDYQKARDQFLLNFISEDSLLKLRNNQTIASPSELGSVDIGLSVLEKAQISNSIVSPDLIFTSVNDIYDYFCYGRNKEREYYVVKEGDTLQGVGYYFGDMSPKQIAMINPTILHSENQVVTPGMELNVTYYTSPITINVTTQRLSQEAIIPEAPEYVEDETLEAGKYEVLVEEETGIKNVLYNELWVNGVLQEGEKQSETVIKLAKRGKIAVGTKQVLMIGTGNFIFPVDNPHITCHYGCYLNHTGTDMVNRYERYGNIYAADSGVVTEVGYRYDMGYYCYIDHQNGFVTIYMHQNTMPKVNEGDNVTRGQLIGQVGNTGRSDGAHLHFTIEKNGTRVNACYYLPCALAN